MHAFRTFALIALCWLAVAAPSYAQALSSAKLLAEIDRDGAKATISRLTASPGEKDWERVLDRIAGGKSDWLHVAALLAEESDAGASTGLYISLAHALPKNPAGVLALAGDQKPFQIKDVCGVRFIEPEQAFLRSYLRRTKRALTKMQDEKLEERRQACVHEIAEAEREIFPSPHPKR